MGKKLMKVVDEELHTLAGSLSLPPFSHATIKRQQANGIEFPVASAGQYHPFIIK